METNERVLILLKVIAEELYLARLDRDLIHKPPPNAEREYLVERIDHERRSISLAPI